MPLKSVSDTDKICADLYWSTRWQNVGAVCNRTFTRRSAVANRTYRFHDVLDRYKICADRLFLRNLRPFFVVINAQT